MADWTQPNDIDPSNGADDVYEGFVKADDNFVDIYSKLTSLRALPGATSPNANDLKHNTTDHKLYYYDSGWVEVGGTAVEYATGLGLDIALAGHSKNVFLQYASGALHIYATTNGLTATLEIDGSLYQVTADINVSIAALTAGMYYVHAAAGVGSAFTIETSTNVAEANKRLIGWFRVISQGIAENSMVMSKEVEIRQDFTVQVGGTLANKAVSAGATYTTVSDGTNIKLEKTVACGPDSDLIVTVKLPSWDDTGGSGGTSFCHVDINGDKIGSIAGDSNYAAKVFVASTAGEGIAPYVAYLRLPGEGAHALTPCVDLSSDMQWKVGATGDPRVHPYMRIQEVRNRGLASIPGDIPIASD